MSPPWAEAAGMLRAAGVENARHEARWLWEGAGGDTARFEAFLARRLAREPLAFILGTQDFRGLELEVSPATLIPRADSETLIEAALAARPDRAGVRRILDLGTGTGCLLLAALAEYPAAFGVGVDRVPAAAALAGRNAVATGLAPRAAFLCGDWATALAARFDLVLCNPPYIDSAAVPTLMAEVARYEPATALDGGPEGLDCYRAIVATLPLLLAPGGVAVLELGIGQAPCVADLARAAGLSPPVLRSDPGGIARAAVLSCCMA